MQIISNLFERIMPYRFFELKNVLFICGAAIVILSTIVFIVTRWGFFKKAGRKGWLSIVPIYNRYLMCKITLNHGWLFIFYMVPLLNLLLQAIVCIKMALRCGKSAKFAIGCLLLPHCFLPILAYDTSEYTPPEKHKKEKKKNEKNVYKKPKEKKKQNHKSAAQAAKDLEMQKKRKKYYKKHKKR